MSPPTEIEQLEEVNKRLVSLRDALKIKGAIEQAEGQSKLIKDKSLIESESFLENQGKWNEVEEETKNVVKKIQAALRFAR